MNVGLKTQLYQHGIKLSIKFCKKNSISLPTFMTYDELVARDGMPIEYKGDESSISVRFAQKVMPHAAVVGANTGLYHGGIIFVNVAVTALPVENPGMRRWSYPGWKTDRTAVGVVAHELGHHVDACLAKLQGEYSASSSPEWREVLRQHSKRVSGYEPVLAEAWAETLRLFILNPTLLKFALPQRYRFVTENCALVLSERRPWREVLNNHPAYCAAGERWIGTR